jgi:hypothetical protein
MANWFEVRDEDRGRGASLFRAPNYPKPHSPVKSGATRLSGRCCRNPRTHHRLENAAPTSIGHPQGPHGVGSPNSSTLGFGVSRDPNWCPNKPRRALPRVSPALRSCYGGRDVTTRNRTSPYVFRAVYSPARCGRTPHRIASHRRYITDTRPDHLRVKSGVRNWRNPYAFFQLGNWGIFPNSVLDSRWFIPAYPRISWLPDRFDLQVARWQRA